MSKITYEDRCVIEKNHKEGVSYRKTAAELGLSKTAVYYEVQTKKNPDGTYKADAANFRSQEIRYRLKINQRKIKNPEILDIIEKQLKRKKSPYDISCCIKQKHPKKYHISYETIYNIIFSYKNMMNHRCENWYKHLRYKHKKRHKRGHSSRHRQRNKYFHSLKNISKQRKEAFSVWEVDTMYLYSGFIAVAVDRVSKKIMAMPIPALKAEIMDKAMRFLFARVPQISAIICDRGSENVSFKNWQRFLNTRVYACDPGSPWQKGLVESTIRQLRCTFGRNTKYENITNKDVYKEAARLNNMRRSSLNGMTSNEVYYQNLAKVS